MGNKNSYKSGKDKYPETEGELYFADGVYYGSIKFNQPHGLGKYWYNSGEYYIGEFFQGYMSGNGSYYDQEGFLVYCGEWKDSCYHGVGTLYEKGKIWYWGEWFLGEAKGRGILYDEEGKIQYEGFMSSFQETYSEVIRSSIQDIDHAKSFNYKSNCASAPPLEGYIKSEFV